MIVDEGVTVVGAEEEQVQHLKQRNVSFVEKLSKSSTQAVFTREQVRRLCVEEGKGQGNSLLVVIFQHHVLDLTKWQHQHPGGLLPLKHLAGQDATDHILAFHPAHVITDRLPRFIIGQLSDSEVANVPLVSSNWQKLHAQLTSEGLFNTDYAFYWREVAKFVLLFILVWVLLLATPVYAPVLSLPPFVGYMASAVVLACLWHQAAFVAHDAGHNGITHDSTADRVIGILIANVLGGLSIEWWKSSHNVHHILTNHVLHDPDIQHLPFFAVSTKFFDNLYSSYHNRIMHFRDSLPARVLVSMQHYLFYVVLFFGRFNLFAMSYIHLFRSAQSRDASARWARYEIAAIAIYWSWYPYLLSHLLPSWPTLLAYLLVSNGLTFLLHVQITISHFGLPADDTPTVQVDEPFEPFATRNLRTTMDVDCPRWMDWFHGGLQYQVTHHVFPRLPRHNLRRVRPRVMQFAKDNGLDYLHYGFIRANGLVLGSMAEVASQVKIYSEVASHLLRNPVHS